MLLQSDKVAINFNATGIYGAGNTFTAQLSDRRWQLRSR
jgi:hypothetical protein